MQHLFEPYLFFAQVGYHDMVIDMMPNLLENWEFRRVFKQDLMLALAVAYCNKSRELLKDEKVGMCQIMNRLAFQRSNLVLEHSAVEYSNQGQADYVLFRQSYWSLLLIFTIGFNFFSMRAAFPRD